MYGVASGFLGAFFCYILLQRDLALLYVPENLVVVLEVAGIGAVLEIHIIAEELSVFTRQDLGDGLMTDVPDLEAESRTVLEVTARINPAIRCDGYHEVDATILLV